MLLNIILLKKMLPKCDCLLLQETWLTENEFTRRFKNEFPNSEIVVASQMDLDSINSGRPYSFRARLMSGKTLCE